MPLSLDNQLNGTPNPKGIKLCIGAGADGSYTMYEDDGTSMDYKKGQFVTTEYKVAWDDKGVVDIKICKADGVLSLIPSERKYEIKIYGVNLVKDKVAVSINGNEEKNVCFNFDSNTSIFTLYLSNVITDSGVELSITGLKRGKNNYKEQVVSLLKNAWSDNCEKDAVFNGLNSLNHDDFLEWLKEENCSELLKDAIAELCGK